MENRDDRKLVVSVLEKINELYLHTRRGNLLLYVIPDFFSNNNGRNNFEEDRIIFQLKDWGVYKLEDREEVNGDMHYYLQLDKVRLEEIFMEYKGSVVDKGSKVSVLQLPLNTKWEQITIKFIDGHDVIIIANGQKYNANYAEMGLQDTRKSQPNTQWSLLKLLATKEGFLTWDDKGADSKYKKQKQLLSEKLQKYFGISDDPFCDYKKERGYKTKFILIPENNIIHPQKQPTDEIEEFRKEQSPEVYDHNV